MSDGWTPERRARQAELIRTWRPWEKSTGPRTAAGKQASSKNRAVSLARAEAELAAARARFQRLRGGGKGLGKLQVQLQVATPKKGRLCHAEGR